MTKIETYHWLCRQGAEVAFVANILLTRREVHQGKSAQRLRKIADLVRSGCRVRCADFSFTITADGNPVVW